MRWTGRRVHGGTRVGRELASQHRVAQCAGRFPSPTYKVVRPAELLDSVLPMPFFSEQLVDFIVEVADAKLAEAG